MTGGFTKPKLLGLAPRARAAAIFTLSGIAGTGGGGASSIEYGVRGVPPLLWLRWWCGPGLGERKVRSVIDPEDDCLLRCWWGLEPGRWWALLLEEVAVKLELLDAAEAERRRVRFV